MDILARIAEQRIREAMERGEFDNLPLHGQPLKLDDLTSVPEHLRMGYKIRNSRRRVARRNATEERDCVAEDTAGCLS